VDKKKGAKGKKETTFKLRKSLLGKGERISSSRERIAGIRKGGEILSWRELSFYKKRVQRGKLLEKNSDRGGGSV